jgi:hypothetical protein
MRIPKKNKEKSQKNFSAIVNNYMVYNGSPKDLTYTFYTRKPYAGKK